MMDFMNRPIEVGDYLLSTKYGYTTPPGGKYTNDVFLVWKVGKLVQYEDKDHYLIQEQTNPSNLLLISDGKNYYKMTDAELMLQKLQEG